MKRVANLIRATCTSPACRSGSCSNNKANDDDKGDKDGEDNGDLSAVTTSKTITTRGSRMDQDYAKHWSSGSFCL